MHDRQRGTDVLEVLEWMRPDLDRLGADWPEIDREQMLNRVLANPGGRRRAGRWTGWAGVAAVAAGRCCWWCCWFLGGRVGRLRSTPRLWHRGR